MGNGGVRMMMLGEKRAEYPSGMVRLSRLTAVRESLGATARRRELELVVSLGDSAKCRWCVVLVVVCVWCGEDRYVIAEGSTDERMGKGD